MIVAASFDTNNPQFLLNRAMQYGDGLFETMRVHNGVVPLFDLHLDRLNQGLNKLHLVSIEKNAINFAISKLNHDLIQSCILKLIVFRTNQDRTYQPKTEQIEWIVTAHPLKNINSPGSTFIGVAKEKLAHNKKLAGLKHLNRIEQVLIANELNASSEVDDLLIVDYLDRIIETTHKNIVFIKGDRLFTPKLNNCGVYGVGLKWLEGHFKVKAKHIKLKNLNKYDVLLVGNSIRGFKTVQNVHDSHLNQSISFATSHPIQDKITHLWNNQFD